MPEIAFSLSAVSTSGGLSGYCVFIASQNIQAEVVNIDALTEGK